MNFLNKYSKNVVKYDFINKFNYNLSKAIPKLKSIVLTFNIKNSNLQTLYSALSALEFIIYQKPTLIFSKTSNISIKLRKGQPVGCKVTLRKSKLTHFLFILVNKVKLKRLKAKAKTKVFFSCRISNILIFNQLEKNYKFFKHLSDLNVNISTTNCNNDEVLFLLKSHKLIEKQM